MGGITQPQNLDNYEKTHLAEDKSHNYSDNLYSAPILKPEILEKIEKEKSGELDNEHLSDDFKETYKKDTTVGDRDEFKLYKDTKEFKLQQEEEARKEKRSKRK
ncbi:hypothetical protein ABK040_008316 [Willaertia magna]